MRAIFIGFFIFSLLLNFYLIKNQTEIPAYSFTTGVHYKLSAEKIVFKYKDRIDGLDEISIFKPNLDLNSFSNYKEFKKASNYSLLFSISQKEYGLGIKLYNFVGFSLLFEKNTLNNFNYNLILFYDL